MPMLEKLPAKGIRFSLTTGIGMAFDAIGAGGVGTAIGAGIGAIDAFFLESIFRGWRPSLFVNELKDVISR